LLECEPFLWNSETKIEFSRTDWVSNEAVWGCISSFDIVLKVPEVSLGSERHIKIRGISRENETSGGVILIFYANLRVQKVSLGSERHLKMRVLLDNKVDLRGVFLRFHGVWGVEKLSLGSEGQWKLWKKKREKGERSPIASERNELEQ